VQKTSKDQKPDNLSTSVAGIAREVICLQQVRGICGPPGHWKWSASENSWLKLQTSPQNEAPLWRDSWTL